MTLSTFSVLTTGINRDVLETFPKRMKRVESSVAPGFSIIEEPDAQAGRLIPQPE
jgi:hypothetical protein